MAWIFGMAFRMFAGTGILIVGLMLLMNPNTTILQIIIGLFLFVLGCTITYKSLEVQ